MAVDMRGRCRLCAELCNYEEDFIFTSEHSVFTELVHKYMCITIVSDDALPLNICYLCRHTIQTFDEFVLKCKDTQETLKAIQQSENIENDVKEIANMKVEVKFEEDSDNVVEQMIKTETVDYYDENDAGEDGFCDEDFLPLVTTYTKPRQCHPTSAHWTVKKSKSAKKGTKIQNKNITKVKKKQTKIVKEKVKKIRKEKIEKIDDSGKIDFTKESLSIQKTFFNFSCHICQERYDSWIGLKQHTREIHSTKPRIQCMCSKYISLKKQLLHHLLKHVENFGIKCPKCPRKFVTEKYLEKHMAVHDIEYKCAECNKIFNTAYGLRMHGKSHIPVELRATHSCDLCDSKFLNNAAVVMHKKAVHENFRPFICDVCGKNFVSMGAVKAHQVNHTSEMRFSCPQCPKKFKHKSHLKRHVDYHNGVTYKCPECGALFTTKRTLDCHFMIHRDVYKFICGYCGKKFKWKSSFQSHINNHTGETPYKCEWCPKTFSDGPNCRIHKRRKHPVELAASDAKKAAENPKTARKETTIIRETKVRDPSQEPVIVFPPIGKNDENIGNDSLPDDDSKEEKKIIENNLRNDSLSSMVSLTSD